MAPRPVENGSRTKHPEDEADFPDEFVFMARPGVSRSMVVVDSTQDQLQQQAAVRPIEELEKLDPCMMTDEERELLQRHKRRQDAYKTALCDTFRRLGHCSYGDACRFAHNQSELRVPAQPRGRLHPKYKTVLCENFERDGMCRYGSRCMYIHRKAGGMNSTIGGGMMVVEEDEDYHVKPDVVSSSSSSSSRSYRVPSYAPSSRPSSSSHHHNNTAVTAAALLAAGLHSVESAAAGKPPAYPRDQQRSRRHGNHHQQHSGHSGRSMHPHSFGFDGNVSLPAFIMPFNEFLNTSSANSSMRRMAPSPTNPADLEGRRSRDGNYLGICERIDMVRS